MEFAGVLVSSSILVQHRFAATADEEDDDNIVVVVVAAVILSVGWDVLVCVFQWWFGKRLRYWFLISFAILYNVLCDTFLDGLMFFFFRPLHADMHAVESGEMLGLPSSFWWEGRNWKVFCCMVSSKHVRLCTVQCVLFREGKTAWMQLKFYKEKTARTANSYLNSRFNAAALEPSVKQHHHVPSEKLKKEGHATYGTVLYISSRLATNNIFRVHVMPMSWLENFRNLVLASFEIEIWK